MGKALRLFPYSHSRISPNGDASEDARGRRGRRPSVEKASHTHCDETENFTGSRTKSAEEKNKKLRPTRNVQRNRIINVRIKDKD